MLTRPVLFSVYIGTNGRGIFFGDTAGTADATADIGGSGAVATGRITLPVTGYHLTAERPTEPRLALELTGESTATEERVDERTAGPEVPDVVPARLEPAADVGRARCHAGHDTRRRTDGREVRRHARPRRLASPPGTRG